MTIFIPAPEATALINSGPVELRTQARLTRSFIQADPTSLVFHRSQREQTSDGGWRDVPAFAVEEQVGKMCELGGQGINYPGRTEQGKMRAADFLLVMEVGADVEVGDWFMSDGKKWEVMEVGRNLGYEVRLLVAQYG